MATPKKAPATRRYTVCTPLIHDHRSFAAGEVVEMTDRQARYLRAGGFIEPVTAAKPATTPAKGAAPAKKGATA